VPVVLYRCYTILIDRDVQRYGRIRLLYSDRVEGEGGRGRGKGGGVESKRRQPKKRGIFHRGIKILFFNAVFHKYR
jgi:hypothetical protein